MTSEPRSWLFVPADSEKKIAKGLAGDADAIILDCEDSVAEANKPAARERAAETLRNRPETGPEIWVRINPLDGPHAEADCDIIAPARPDGVMLPKSEDGDHVARLSAMLDARDAGEAKIIALVTETPASLFGAGTYKGVSERLTALTWGAEDLSSALGAVSKFDEDGAMSFTYKLARSLCLAGAVAADCQPVETLFADFRDEEGLRLFCEAARREGFTGMMAIHPAQVAVINAAFTPSEEEIAHARAVVQAFADNPDAGTIGLDGKMIDRPHLVLAERLLERAGRG